MSAPYHPALHRFAVFTALSTLLLVLAGGLVTSTGSSLSVPDWPLSFGQVFPKMEGGVFYEHGHRMIAASVGLLVSVLMVWLLKSEPRRWVRRLGVAAFLAVVAQGVLGGITVLFKLPLLVSMGHACL
ncbi:MAG: COX15/CtaA family protein, partial [Acidobacteria bacterium]|nr:COX15/CtaA family protein [Acidobacteriota bacterium]